MTTEAPEPRIAVPEDLHADGLKNHDPHAPIVDLHGETMGTSWHVRIALPDRHQADAIKSKIDARLADIVAQMSHWDSSSLLCEFNAAKPGSWTNLPKDFARVIGCALDIAEQSGGAFNPAQGRLTDIWGLGPRKREQAPGDAERQAALSQSAWHRLAFEPETGRLRQPGGIWLDLSGIAKGYAADAVADLLAADGLYHALVEIGGECVGRGIRPDGNPWWVDVETPADVSLPPLRIALHQLAVATSGDYFRGAHTLDPTTGMPAIHGTTAVSVIHESCMSADAWATALSVLSLPKAQELAEVRHLIVRILTRDGGEWLSPALLKLI